MGDEFRRPEEGFKFEFGGMKTNSRPDTLPPGKYPLALNVRGYFGGTVQSRPGVAQLFVAQGSPTQPITDMRGYSRLNAGLTGFVIATQFPPPRFLAYGLTGQVWLDGTGANVGSLTVGAGIAGASMIPFRPSASPLPWMYVANGGDYQKFSAPAQLTDAVTQRKVGIAEPQTAPDATLFVINEATFGSANPGWSAGGTAGAVSNGTRLSDTAGVVLPDPAAAPSPGLVNSIQVGSAIKYARQIPLEIHSQSLIVQDVFPPLLATVNIAAIRYFSGTTGRCVVVPTNLGAGPGSSEQSIYLQNLLATLRRGALIKIASEICYVWSVAIGPDGTVAIETSTTGAHTTSDVITGVPAIQVDGGSPVATNAIGASDVTYAVTVGIGTQTASVSNPFAVGGSAFQPDDLITLGVLVDNLANLNEVKFLIDVSDGTFTSDFYYYTIRPSDIASAVANSATQLANLQTLTQRAIIDEETGIASGNQVQASTSAQLAPGSSQWSQIVFPISALTRVGNDQSKSLQNVVKIQFLWNANATINVATSEIFVIGGSQPDVGDTGAPYLYRVRPRDSRTGVVGNPSPATRYGVNARRTSIAVALPSAAYDSQIDTWDVYRYGGSVLSWRFIGSTASSNSFFTDNYSDSAADAGDPLDFDNFEPWPSVDLPNTGTASVVNGTVAVVSTTDTDITRYLPGTLVQLGGQNVYTLWTRPTLISGTNYLLQFVENAGAGTSVPYIIQEPLIARQLLPYMWGPDADGTVFAVGDAFRPGTVSFCKNYAPDSAPDTYNLEISAPSEPLMGGETIDGLSFVATSEKWWALYPQPGNTEQRYAVVQQPFARGLAAPFGHCTDGVSLFWWAKDGIYSSSKGSLTDADLFNLFPHEGVAGTDISSTISTNFNIHAPDYTRSGSFRLVYANGFLYAIYQDFLGVYRCLTLDLHRMAWCIDQYGVNGITAAYHVEQPPSATTNKMTVFATFGNDPVTGNYQVMVGQQGAAINDFATGVLGSGTPILCAIATAEYNGGDDRAPKQWGDFFVDLTPTAATGVSVTPMSLGAGIAAPTVILQPGSGRQRVPVSVGGILVSDFMGILASWTDDFNAQNDATKLYLWQPSYVIQPAWTIAWDTFGSSFGLSGYMHVREVVLAYVSSAPITLAVQSFDGQSPAPITIPSSGGAYVKVLFPLSANKGQLYGFKATSAAKFQLFLADSEIRVGGWGRQGPYLVSHNMGDKTMAEAVI